MAYKPILKDKLEQKQKYTICKRITKRSVSNSMVIEERYLLIDGDNFKDITREFNKKWQED